MKRCYKRAFYIVLFFVFLTLPINNSVAWAKETSKETETTEENQDSSEVPKDPENPNDPENPDEPEEPGIPVEKITLKETEIRDLKIGDTYKLEAEVLPQDATDQELKYRIALETPLKSDVSNSVLSVDEKTGLVTIKGLGEAIVEAYWGDKENRKIAQCKFTVYQTYFDVVKLGADGTDKLVDTAVLKKALQWATAVDEPVTVYVPEGIYYIDDTLYIYSDTKLILHDKAIISRNDNPISYVMLQSKYETKATGGYTQCVNVEITGGIWDGHASGHPHSNNIYIGHASNINIHDTAIINNGSCHLLEFAGVRDSVINKVILSGFIPCTGCDLAQQTAKEAIQLDYCTSEAARAMIPYDKTTCENIIIRGCNISNYMCGIGQHSVHSGVSVNNIIIENNTFSNITNCCIDVRNYRNVLINNNKAASYNTFLYAYNSTGVVRNNSLDNSAFPLMISESRMASNSMYLCKGSQFVINANAISGCDGNGISVAGKSNVIIQNNRINNNTKYGIKVDGSTVIISENDVYDNAMKRQYYADETSNITCDDIRIYNVTYKNVYYHTGKKIKPTVKIKGLEVNKDFKVTYKNNKKVGTAKIIITGKGKMKGTQTLKFKIKKKKKKKENSET